MKSLLNKCFLLVILLLSTQALFAQEHTLTGKVIDATTGNPLTGVTVRVKEAPTVGTVTGADGSYSLSVPAAAKTLVFSYVGYSNLEVPVTGNTVNAQMSSGKNLEEVIVVGYGTQKAKDVSAAIASISTEDFNKGVVTNPVQQIQGKVAGLVITQPGGDPNQSAIIRLRGQTSLTGGQTPLIVVDGVPLDDPNQIANIPPGDIASYDVLKDASATAIYGSRGANGVIIINTKKGKAGKATVDYSGYIGMDRVAKKYDLLNAAEWKTGAKQVGTDDATIASYDHGGNTDWMDAITRTAVTHSHNLGISGGTDKFTYRGSASYINQEGVVINTGKEELGLRFHGNLRAIKDKLDIQMGIVNTQTNRKYADYSIFTYIFSTPPVYPVYNADGSYFGYYDFEQQNPVAQQMEQLNTGKEHFTQMYGTVDYELLAGLKVGTTGSLSYFTKHTDFFQPTLPGVGNINNGNQYSEDRNSKKGDIHINYTHDWNNKHNLSLTGVYEYNNFIYDNFKAQGQDFLLEGNQDNNLANGDAAHNVITSYKDEYTLISFLGRVTYNYAGKYYAEASLRRDGSSKFGVNNRWGNFPSVSVAWRLSEEGFMKSVPWVNELKLRAGYGVTGNQDAISPYNTQLLLDNVGKYYDKANDRYLIAYAPKQNANPDLRWEERHGTNIGLDFSFFDNRFSGDLNVFNDKTTNLLYNYTVPVPPFYVNTILANVGTLTNKGVEVQLNGNIVNGKDFSWSASGQISFIRTRVTDLSGTYAGYQVSTDNIRGGVAEGRGLSDNPITYLKLNYSPYVFFLPHYVGVDASGKQLFDSAGVKINAASNGTFRYIDPSPKFNYGFSSTFNYHNLSLNFFLRGVYGQKIFNNTRLLIDNITRLPGNNVTREALKNGINDAPIASDLWLENASYLRLDNITLAYNFKKIKGIQNLQLYIAANNLFVITPYTGLDPEIRTTGDNLNNSGVENEAYIDANYGSDGYYPRTRSFSFGVNVSFQ